MSTRHSLSRFSLVFRPLHTTTLGILSAVVKRIVPIWFELEIEVLKAQLEKCGHAVDVV